MYPQKDGFSIIGAEAHAPSLTHIDDDHESEDWSAYNLLHVRRPSRSIREHVAAGTIPLWLFNITSVISVLLGLALFYVVNSSRPTSHTGYDFSGYLCAPRGAPAELALARGCIWDTFSNYWFPKERYESDEMQALMNEFTAMGWPRYYDKEAQQPVVVLDRSHPWAWVSKKEHYWHCGYALIQTHLWLEQGFDPPGPYSHTKHCAMMLLEVIESHPPPNLMEISANLSIPSDPEHWPVVSIRLPTSYPLKYRIHKGVA